MSWLLRATALVCCTLAVPWLVVSASQIASDQQSRSDSPTFNADVAPILRAKCLTCHRQDGDAPVPLETISQVRRRASLIVQLTASGYMPPWKPAMDSPAYIGERRLSDREKATLKQWVADGMPEGDDQPIPAGQSGKQQQLDMGTSGLWSSPSPTMSCPLARLMCFATSSFGFHLPAHASCAGFNSAREVAPCITRISGWTQHQASAELDRNDPAPGYEGVILHSAQYPPGHFLGWTPGQAAAPSGELCVAARRRHRLRRSTAHAVDWSGRPHQSAVGFVFHSRPSCQTTHDASAGTPGSSNWRGRQGFHQCGHVSQCRCPSR